LAFEYINQCKQNEQETIKHFALIAPNVNLDDLEQKMDIDLIKAFPLACATGSKEKIEKLLGRLGDQKSQIVWGNALANALVNVPAVKIILREHNNPFSIYIAIKSIQYVLVDAIDQFTELKHLIPDYTLDCFEWRLDPFYQYWKRFVTFVN
jgi:hypothetical protein